MNEGLTLYDLSDIIDHSRSSRRRFLVGALGGIGILAAAAACTGGTALSHLQYPNYRDHLKNEGMPIVVLNNKIRVSRSMYRHNKPFFQNENVSDFGKEEIVTYPLVYQGDALRGIGTAPWLGWFTDKEELNWICLEQEQKALTAGRMPGEELHKYFVQATVMEYRRDEREDKFSHRLQAKMPDGVVPIAYSQLVPPRSR